MAANAEPQSSQEPGRVETARKFALGRGLRNFEAGCDRRAFSESATDVNVFRGVKTLRPHRRAGANEVVQRQNECGEARARSRIAIKTIENKLVEASRYGVPVMPRAHRPFPNLRMRIVRSPFRERQPSGEQLVNGHAEPEHVGRRCDGLTQTFLRRHIGVGAGVLGRAGLVLKTSDSEVEQDRATVSQYDVRRLHVHMYEAALVDVSKSGAKVDRHT